ncbi:hypothetical protein ALP8811_00168 [Aliiroseovarius pelagivivens]|uniref:DUF1800 domain-containing protein n=1 Tax=Aliiroseovarius pelagivivens TaxID=1639690 RepID=A0A2R8AGK2_9RHOB|nr:DUF1800 domain-containing protein [Aliiroseovarius pelagivivens]SPF75183.1 hypothetical protein ALP8811_00168 [Aliiroseovarius pelagivivens]
MSFDPYIAQNRFGYGPGPGLKSPTSVQHMLDLLAGPDTQAERFPISGFAEVYGDLQDIQTLTNAFRKARSKGGPGVEIAKTARKEKYREMSRQRDAWFLASLNRCTTAQDAFRERLVRFWTDHFTVIGKGPRFKSVASTFAEDVVRPNVGGRFADMLRASSTHPVMLHYLDQFASAGEGSKLAMKGKRSLNENLAREILELHTLGVDGNYTQDDVRAFANLLAGLTLDDDGRTGFRPQKGNPGPEIVLGKSYGRQKPRVDDIFEALDDIARHPDTARHIARKLATHFVSDDPDTALVDALTVSFTKNDGDLMALYETLLNHPISWATKQMKVKQPFDFVASAIRSLGIPTDALTSLKRKERNLVFFGPLKLMGQPWESPDGPDGWPEDAADWITPQGLAARIQWAISAPSSFDVKLPDPRDFVQTALAGQASETTNFAARAAETRWEAIGIILASPEFQRR